MTTAPGPLATSRTAPRLWTLVLSFVGLLVAFVVAVALVRTSLATIGRASVEPAAAELRAPADAAERLAGALRIATISAEDPADFDGSAFRELHEYLRISFPRVHAELRRETVNEYSLLYTWEGRDPTLAPILLMGHLDVVPIEAGTEWSHPPFSGRIVDDFVWGRGAIDNKSAVVGMLEAVDLLLAGGFRPERTVYLAYGHDEEVGGTNGARHIAALLRERGVRLEMVIDEGGVIGEDILPVEPAVALVGIAEKGFLSLELVTQSGGGHSSLPPAQSAVGIVSAAIARIEEDQLPARLEGPTRELFERLGPEFPFLQRVLFANLWLTAEVVAGELTRSPTTAAMVRTTTAATIFQAGTKDNVLPSQARAVINFRIAPGDSIAGVIEHVERVVDDPRVEVRIGGRFSAEPSAVSSTASDSFRRLERTIASVYPDAIVAPYLVVVGTDSRYFADLGESTFRFLPVRVGPDDLERIHGADERISVSDYEDAIRLYHQLIVDAAGR
jgi:carboxypeptidase PM20D1